MTQSVRPYRQARPPGPSPDILCGCGDRSRLMRMEWLRASDNFPACWACFLVYDDRVDVLAITGSKQRIDHSMSPDEAGALWADLCECGWHRASEEEITRHQMSHRKLRSIVYGGLLSPAIQGSDLHRHCCRILRT